jgi:hypothetical protein
MPGGTGTDMVDHEAVQIYFNLADHAAKAPPTRLAGHRKVIGIASCINLFFSG